MREWTKKAGNNKEGKLHGVRCPLLVCVGTSPPHTHMQIKYFKKCSTALASRGGGGGKKGKKGRQ